MKLTVLVWEKNLDHGGVSGLGNLHDGSGREPGEIRGIRLGGDQSIRRPAPVEETGVRGVGPHRPRRSGHHPAGALDHRWLDPDGHLARADCG
jgi:hypothetical protein